MTLHRPLSDVGPVRLASTTDPAWLPQAIAQFDQVLIDHAHCEKKAASNALSMLQAYPDLLGMPAQMARLAREESAHLARVLDLMEARGLTLTRDPGDPYVQALQRLVRTSTPERRLDRLLVAAVVEARSCERLSLLADGISAEVVKATPGFDAPLAQFYRELAQSEDGHQALFFRLACDLAGAPIASERLERLLSEEAGLLRTLSLRPAIH